MPEVITGKIRKVKLSNGAIYSIFDAGSIHLNENNILVTDNTIIDEAILNGHFYITEIDDIPVENSISNVLVQNETTGEIQKRSTDYLLEDIGGISYGMDSNTGVLSFKFGKQEENEE